VTSRERMAVAMRHAVSDRVPVMCQLALGHYFLHSGLDPVEVWHDSEAFADALVLLQRRYGFDGILVNLPGRDPEWRRHVVRVEAVGRDRHVVWENGRVTVCPPDDNPHVFLSDRRTRFRPQLEDLDCHRLFYLEPHDLFGLAWEWTRFPPWHWDTLRKVREGAPDVSVHGEVFSPFSQLCEAVGADEALLALRTDPGRVKACLEALCTGTVELMAGHVAAGADAVLVSSAYAGGGLISTRHYREFVLPVEASIVSGFKARCPATPVYTHTCGAIGDRLELLEETGTDGIDTLDPPPLGDVDLAEAKQRVGARLFLKGNVDPVGTVLLGTPDVVRADAARRIVVGGRGGGYVLSTACSVPPGAPPENVAQLRAAADAVRSD
jgi:Uroporphyrinogen decarboxylase (URO-D)